MPEYKRAEVNRDIVEGVRAPLVTILIPTYNRPEYLRVSLESVLNQTYKNLDIVISDDSTNDDTERMIEEYIAKDSRIQYFRNRNFTGEENWNFLQEYNNPESEYVNWLMDDDLFMPNKIETMLRLFQQCPQASMVTSRKKIIDADGNVKGLSQILFEKTTVIDGENAGKMTLLNCPYPIFGEPTTVLIKKQCLQDNRLGWDSVDYRSCLDMATWLQLSTKGSVVYCAEPLSAYRVHPGQDGEQAAVRGAIGWSNLMKHAWDIKKFLTTENEVRNAIITWLSLAAWALRKAVQQGEDKENVQELERRLMCMSWALSNGYHIM